MLMRFNKTFSRLIVLATIIAMMLGMMPNSDVLATGTEPETFVTATRGNHWGRSDLRAYMNNVDKENNTLPLDSSTEGNNNDYFPSKFSDAEYDLVQPFTYSTNVLDSTGNVISTYEVTDKFWLPSGNINNDGLISWSQEDISSNAQYSRTTKNDKQHLIPISYWSDGRLRSMGLNSAYSLYSIRGYYVGNNVIFNDSFWGATFKVDLSSVIFASAAVFLSYL